MTDQPRHAIRGFGDIPPDLSHPRDPQRAPLIVLAISAAVIFAVCTIVLVYAVIAPWW